MNLKYLFNLGLFREKRMVFKVGGAEKGPDRVKASAEKAEKGPLKDASLMIDDIEHEINNVSDKLSEMKPKTLKGRESLRKAKSKIEKIQKRLQETKKKIEGFMQKKEKAQQGVKVKIDGELRGMYKELTGKEWEKPVVFKPVDMGEVKAPAKKPKSKPSKGKEKKETDPNASTKQKISQLLTKLSKLGGGEFDDVGPELTKLIKKLPISLIEGKTQTLDINPGGFKIAYLKWKDHSSVRPSMMIFKGPKLLAFRTEGRAFQHAHKLDQGESFRYTRRMAELVKSNIVLDNALAQITTTSTGRMAFRTKDGLKNFQASLMNLAKFTAPNKNSWHANYPTAQTDVKFKRVGGGHAFFTINTPNGTIYFHTKNKNYIGFPDVKLTYDAKTKKEKRKVVGVVYWKADDFNLTKVEEKAVNKKEKATKDKAAREKSAKQKKAAREKAIRLKEEAAKKKMVETLQKESKEKAANKAKMSKLINPKFRDIVKFDKNNPRKFKLDAGKSSKAKRLINKTRIHKLLNLKSITKQEVRVKITGPKGVREGVYKPGDKTCYLVKSGNKTKNRLKFYDQDTFEISMKPIKKTT